MTFHIKYKLLLLLTVLIVTLIAAFFGFIRTNNISFITGTRNHDVLKKEDLPSIPEDQLVYTVMNWMWAKFNSDWSNQYTVISSLPKACQYIYSVYTIEAEVNNGGFNQCYYNSSKEFTIMAVDGYKAIGAEGFSQIMIEANTIYSEIKNDLAASQDGTLEGFSKSYEDNPLNALDDKFYKMYEQEPLDKLCIDYIKANAEYFGD